MIQFHLFFTANTAGEAPTVRILLKKKKQRNYWITVQTKRGKRNKQQKNCTEPEKGKKGNSNLAKEAQQRKESWSFWTTESMGL